MKHILEYSYMLGFIDAFLYDSFKKSDINNHSKEIRQQLWYEFTINNPRGISL